MGEFLQDPEFNNPVTSKNRQQTNKNMERIVVIFLQKIIF
jgi:hypothetical protein